MFVQNNGSRNTILKKDTTPIDQYIETVLKCMQLVMTLVEPCFFLLCYQHTGKCLQVRNQFLFEAKHYNKPDLFLLCACLWLVRLSLIWFPSTFFFRSIWFPTRFRLSFIILKYAGNQKILPYYFFSVIRKHNAVNKHQNFWQLLHPLKFFLTHT